MKNFAETTKKLRRRAKHGFSRFVGVTVSIVAIAVAGWWLVRVPPPPPETKLPFATTTSVGADVISGFDGADVVLDEPEFITVHIAGAVKSPGVYRLARGARVNDGVLAAGGATSVANLDVINLATVLNEGEQIYVPKRGEKPHAITSRPQSDVVVGGGDTTNNQPSLININTANAVELEQLPGVGPSTAKAIIEYREKNGGFVVVEDLLKVRGIGPAKLREMLPRVRVS
ncbi:MAG: helix-hairpin-helix domain-containing protein [Actinomycetota bacterium]